MWQKKKKKRAKGQRTDVSGLPPAQGTRGGRPGSGLGGIPLGRFPRVGTRGKPPLTAMPKKLGCPHPPLLAFTFTPGRWVGAHSRKHILVGLEGPGGGGLLVSARREKGAARQVGVPCSWEGQEAGFCARPSQTFPQHTGTAADGQGSRVSCPDGDWASGHGVETKPHVLWPAHTEGLWAKAEKGLTSKRKVGWGCGV